jgi:hypothetical protein
VIALAPVDPRISASLDPASALLVVDWRCGDMAQALMDVADVATSRITVVALPARLGLIGHWAPLSGLTTPQRLAADLFDEAACAAAAAATALGGAPAVLPDWRSVTALIRERCFEVAVLGVMPNRRRARRALVETSATSGTALVMPPPRA